MMLRSAPVLALGSSLMLLAACRSTPASDTPAELEVPSRMTPELLWRLGRVSGGSLDPTGTRLLYAVRRYELAENSGDTDLFVVDLESGETRQLTEGPVSESAAQWAETPAGTRILHLAKRGDDATTQCWALDPESGDLTQVTDVEGGIANLVIAPTGDRIAFTKDVKLDSNVQDLHPDLPQAEARIIDDLMYRHWDAWHEYEYTHLCTAPLDADGKAGAHIDLMEGLRVDCPVPPFGGSEQFAFSEDGRQIAFTMKVAASGVEWAQSTDSDVYVCAADGSTEPKNLSEGMDGYDNNPLFAGGKLYWQSMERPGFEADRNRIMRYDRASRKATDITAGLDQTTHEVTFAPDGRSVYFMSEHRGTNQIFRLSLVHGGVSQVTTGPYNWSLRDIAPDSGTLIVARQNMIRPWEIGRMPAAGGEWKPLTDVNGEIFAQLEPPTVTERWVPATDGKSIHCWVILPPGFDEANDYPLLTYFQGGPQGQIGQWFSYRWNFHLMAAHGGYVVLAPNRRGLPGFGQAWNDQISKDWGGQAMQDILSAHDKLCEEPYVDPERAAGIGASFGGYTAYWMMGNAEDRFACMVSHCGVFNLESMYGATEELFFVDWDLGGPYWQSDALQNAYDRFSPHRYVDDWETPLLVIHGERDFRVPVNQGLEAFQAAQIEGVPSRFLYFPDEGHWVLSPQNGVLWHRVFFDWLERWLRD